MMTSSVIVALAILSSSFFGSWHCAGMCGPIATLMAQRKGLVSYHLGRLVAYTTLGVFAGYLGQIFLNSQFVMLRWISAGLLAAALIASGIYFLSPEKFRNWMMSHSGAQLIWKLLKRLQAFQLGHSAFIVGLLTALLPCGWLYTYLTAAIATRSPWAGGVTLALFWLGGLPALSAIPMMVRKTIATAGLRQQRIAGCVLISAGLYSIVSFMFLH